MRNFEAKHWMVLGGFIVALGTQLAGVEHGWTDVYTPTFIGGILIQLGTTIAAIFVGAPQAKDDEP